MNIFEIIGNNILIQSKKKNLNLSVLAENIGVSCEVLDKIIKGKKAINSYEITKIAETLGITSDILLNSSNKLLIKEDSINYFTGAFSNIENFKLLNSIIEEYINMESDLHEFLQSKKHFA